MRFTKVKKQQWVEDKNQFVSFTLVKINLWSDSEIQEKIDWFSREFGPPGVFKLGSYWYPLLGGIAMDEQVFSWYYLKNNEEA